MMEKHLYKAPPFLLQKMQALCSMLLQDKKKYETVGAGIADQQFRRTILTLAQESNQYATELLSQIETLGGMDQHTAPVNQDTAGPGAFANEEDILSFCQLNEKKMVSAYRDILNESFLYEGLRKMIRYQLNGILCSFTQLKLLQSLKFQ